MPVPPCLAGVSVAIRSPAYPLFRKEKIQLHRRHSTCVAESPERILLRSGLSMWGETLCYKRNPPVRATACTYRSEAQPQSAQKPRCGTESIPHAGGSFFLYEKSVLRESDSLRGREKEVCTNLTHPFSALKKALKITGIQGESLPLGRCSRAEPSRSSPLCLQLPRVKKRERLFIIAVWRQGALRFADGAASAGRGRTAPPP